MRVNVLYIWGYFGDRRINNIYNCIYIDRRRIWRCFVQFVLYKQIHYTHPYTLFKQYWYDSSAVDADTVAKCKIPQQCEYYCIILSAGAQEVSLTSAREFYSFSATLTPYKHYWMGMSIVELLNSFHCYLNTQNSLCIVCPFYSSRIIFIHIRNVFMYLYIV